MPQPVDYDKHGRTYARFRRADPRIARRIVKQARPESMRTYVR